MKGYEKMMKEITKGLVLIQEDDGKKRKEKEKAKSRQRRTPDSEHNGRGQVINNRKMPPGIFMLFRQSSVRVYIFFYKAS